MKFPVVALLLLATTSAMAAENTPTPDRTMSLGAVQMDSLSIQGRLQTWIFSKLCLDGQVYIIINGTFGPSGITASFKDGKPEQCAMQNAQ